MLHVQHVLKSVVKYVSVSITLQYVLHCHLYIYMHCFRLNKNGVT